MWLLSSFTLKYVPVAMIHCIITEQKTYNIFLTIILNTPTSFLFYLTVWIGITTWLSHCFTWFTECAWRKWSSIAYWSQYINSCSPVIYAIPILPMDSQKNPLARFLHHCLNQLFQILNFLSNYSTYKLISQSQDKWMRNHSYIHFLTTLSDQRKWYAFFYTQ